MMVGAKKLRFREKRTRFVQLTAVSQPKRSVKGEERWGRVRVHGGV